ncbi:MAG: argininosuccinate lyase, partial [Alphaproteobacteria bacterium]
MLAEQKICSTEAMTQILRALRRIEDELDPSAMDYTGAFEDLFFYVDGELTKLLGADLAGMLHTGRSRNDMDHTVFKMQLKRRLAGLLGQLGNLLATLETVARRNRDTIVVAYTHGQPAQPTTYGHYLAAFIEVCLRDFGRLLHAARALDLCSMGAAAITTTGFDIDRGRMADLLGFAESQENSYGCIAACDYVTGVYGAMQVMFINMGRFVQDLNQWSGFENGQLYVPNGYVQVSSIMPQKRNPVPVEHLRLISSLGAGRCGTIINVMHNTPFTDMNDSEGEVQIAGYSAFETAERLLSLLAGLIGAVQIDEARVARLIDESCITITELADSLVRVEGISFRQAHGVSGVLARQVVDQGLTLSAVSFEVFARAFEDQLGRCSMLSEDDFRRVLTPEHFIAVRERPGGPGVGALTASLAGYRTEIAQLSEDVGEINERMTGADKRLRAAVDRMVAA